MSGDLRVLFDADIFLRQRFGGISRMFVEIARRLPESGVAPRFFAPATINGYLGELPKGWFVGGRHTVANRWVLAAAWRAPSALTRAAARLARADVVHETYYAPQSQAPRGTPTVITMYDMIHERDASFAGDPVIAWKAAAIARADWITCISENTMRDMVALFPHAADKCSVVPLASELAAPGPIAPQQRPYLLYVGERARDYKNFRNLLAAYADSPPIREGWDLVCIGGGAFDTAENALIEGAGLSAQVRQRFVPDAELATWYAHAGCLVYPSTYEGFGIPPLEAMGAGCPVIAIRAASMPEVCGDAAHYAADPGPRGLATALDAVLCNPAHADALRSRGRAQAALFSWDRCAAQTAEVYRMVRERCR